MLNNAGCDWHYFLMNIQTRGKEVHRNNNMPQSERLLFALFLNSRFLCKGRDILWKGNTVNVRKPCLSQWCLNNPSNSEHEGENKKSLCFSFSSFPNTCADFPCISVPPSLFYCLIYKGGLRAARCFGIEQILGEDL